MKTLTLATLNRNTKLSLEELQSYIKESASNGAGIYKIVINNIDPLVKWGVDNVEETCIIIEDQEHGDFHIQTLFSAYVGNTWVKGKIEYTDWGDIDIYPTSNNINPFMG